MKTQSDTLSSLKTYRVAVAVEIVADEISAYDNEAARRYGRESIDEVRESIHGDAVDLRFRDGKARRATFDLPADLDVEAELTDGEEGDPDGNMSQADFEIRVPASVQFDVDEKDGADEAAVLAIATKLIERRKGGKRVVFDTGCIGDVIRIVSPVRVWLVK